jgi:hypothetical protein
LSAPAAGTCRLAGVEPCRGPRRERTELAGYKLNQTAAALAACVPEVQGSQRRNAAHYHCIVCIGSGRVSEPNCREAGEQQIRAGCNRAMTRRTVKTSTRTGKKNRDSKKKMQGLAKKSSKKKQKTQKTIKTVADPKKRVFPHPLNQISQ